MSEHNITVEGGSSVRLKTAGKYCDRDIVVTATGGSGGSFEEGYASGKADGIELGKQEEYDRFWGQYCHPGGNDYDYAFAGTRWSNDTFTPPAVTLIPKRAMHMFSRTAIKGDLVDILEKYNFVLDFSICARIQQMFANATSITRLGVLDFRSASGESDTVFVNASSLVTIDKLMVGENTNKFNNWFSGVKALENVTFEGVICTAISFSDCAKLSNASVQSIIDHLKDLTGTTAQTLTFHATVGGNLTNEQKATITAKNWTLVY